MKFVSYTVSGQSFNHFESSHANYALYRKPNISNLIAVLGCANTFPKCLFGYFYKAQPFTAHLSDGDGDGRIAYPPIPIHSKIKLK